MLKNHKLAQTIQDVSWSEFFRMLDYKAEWHGKNLIKIGRFWPSTILCDCGTLNKELALADRIWTCKNCGVEHQRDVLAAKNIKKFAFLSNPTQYFSEIYTGQDMSGESVESSAIVEAVKQKPAKSAKTERRKESNVL
jgi:putative transposase